MKRILFLFGLLVCLAGMPLTAFADNKTAKQTYETAISDNWKTMLKNSIALDTINADRSYGVSLPSSLTMNLSTP